jgi:hypothetical protein
LKTVASSPPSQRAESTLSFSNRLNATQGPMVALLVISSLAAAAKLRSPVPLGVSEVRIT